MPRSLLHRGLPIAFLLAFAPAPAHAAGAPRDPLLAIVHRMNRYFHQHEVGGVTLDSRYDLNPTEVARLSVVSQLLGYAELYRVYPIRTFRTDIDERAEYLLGRFDEILSGGPFDGMVGEAMLEAYAVTGDSRYLAAGKRVVDNMEALPTYETILNGGLMAALALARYHQLTGDPVSAARARDIVSSLPPYQNADGSFPHWCYGSRDVHYTGWMTMELILIDRMLPDPEIRPMLQRMLTFMEGRVGPDGVTRYQDACDAYPGCVEYYYSIATGCGIDYDTRAFTNELGYTALLFDTFHSPQYRDVIRFFASLENNGTFKDKWDFWPPPSDPYYPWTVSDTSVVNMSVIFWSLGSIVSGRRVRPTDHGPGFEDEPSLDDEPVFAAKAPRLSKPALRARPLWSTVDSLLLAGASPYACVPIVGHGTVEPLPASPRAGTLAVLSGAATTPDVRLGILPNPMRTTCRIRWVMSATSGVSLDIHDLTGRLVRRLVTGTVAAGEHAVVWDRRDDAGMSCPNGVYLARLGVAAGSGLTAKLLVID